LTTFFFCEKKIGLVFHYYHYTVWLSEDQENQSKFERKKKLFVLFSETLNKHESYCIKISQNFQQDI